MIALLAALQFALPADTATLRRAAVALDVPPAVIYAVAWKESRRGERLNDYRGPGREQCDSLGCRRVCREIGRMQINPCIQWRIPACNNLRDYWSNVVCGAAILRSNYRTTKSWPLAIRKYNGSGPRAEAYMREALTYIGWLSLRQSDSLHAY